MGKSILQKYERMNSRQIPSKYFLLSQPILLIDQMISQKDMSMLFSFSSRCLVVANSICSKFSTLLYRYCTNARQHQKSNRLHICLSVSGKLISLYLYSCCHFQQKAFLSMKVQSSVIPGQSTRSRYYLSVRQMQRGEQRVLTYLSILSILQSKALRMQNSSLGASAMLMSQTYLLMLSKSFLRFYSKIIPIFSSSCQLSTAQNSKGDRRIAEQFRVRMRSFPFWLPISYNICIKCGSNYYKNKRQLSKWERSEGNVLYVVTDKEYQRIQLIRTIKQAMSENDSKITISSALRVNSVSAYLRLPNSHSLKLQLNPQLNLSHLQPIIAERLKIPQSHQIIYYKGRQLRQGKLITISDRAIFHIKDKRDMLQQISIDIILHQPQPRNFFKVNPTFTTLTVNQEETLGDFLKKYLGSNQQKLDLKRSRIIECGRFLKWDKTFKEMNIQHKAQIHVIIREKIGEDGHMEEQQNQQHEKLISRVLKHSRQNSIELQKEKEQKVLIKQEFDGVLQIEEKVVQQESHICNFGEEEEQPQQGSIIENPSEIFGKSNPELDKSLMKSQSSLLLSHTKSSQKFIRQKSAKQELTPLKLGIRKYKRYEGPLSVRACHCKKKLFESQQHIKLSQSSHGLTLTPCLGGKSSKSHNKSQNKLKKSCALIN